MLNRLPLVVAIVLLVPRSVPAQPIPIARNQIELAPSDHAAGDRFGTDAGISDDTVLIGAEGKDGTGSASVFLKSDPTLGPWAAIAELQPSDFQPGDRFGASVSVSGDTAVVGAPEHHPAPGNSGAVYVFERDAGGPEAWAQVKKLALTDGEPDDRFGTSVAISGDTLVVGAPHDDEGAIESGLAYVFERDTGGPGAWGHVKTLVPSDPTADAAFGWSVALDGDRVVVGAPSLDVDGHPEAGAAYLFERDAGGDDNWGEVRKLTVSEPNLRNYTHSGGSVAIDGDAIVVGGGGFLIVERDAGGPGNWGEVKFKKSLGESLGSDVALRGDTCIAGATSGFTGNTTDGVVFVYQRDSGGPGEWGQVAKLFAPIGESNGDLGWAVALGSDGVVIGGDPNDDHSGANSGSAYAFAFRSSCPETPAAGCVDTWAKGSFSATGRTVEKSNLTLKLSKGPALSQGDFGDPLELGGTAYDVCVYDDQDRLAAWLRADRAGQQCGSRDCWKWWQGLPPSGLGFRYADKSLLSDGLSKIDLKGGAAGSTSIAVGAKNGDRVPFPLFSPVGLGTGVASALKGSDSVTIQLHGSDAPQCFSKTLTNVTKNDGQLFKAK